MALPASERGVLGAIETALENEEPRLACAFLAFAAAVAHTGKPQPERLRRWRPPWPFRHTGHFAR